MSFGVRLLAGLVVAGTILLLSGWFASEVFENETLAFDEAVRQWIHQFATPVLTQVMIGVSFIGSPVFLIALGIIVFCVFLYLGWKRAALLFAITMTGEIILDICLKGFFSRSRPDPFFDYKPPASFSFPSGHALGSFCFYGILAWLIGSRIKNGKARWLIGASAALVVLLIGLSRVYLGVHYPTDILAGYLTAFIWTATVVLSDSFFEQRG